MKNIFIGDADYEGFVKYILEQAVLHSAIDIGAERERIRSMFAGRKFSDSAELLHEDGSDDGSP